MRGRTCAAEAGHPRFEAPIRCANGLAIERWSVHGAQGHRDVVAFRRSFEHIPDQQATLAAVARLLALGAARRAAAPLPASHRQRAHARAAGRPHARSRAARLHGLPVPGQRAAPPRRPLRDPRSWAENPGAGLFSAAQMADWQRRAETLNAAGQGDQAAFHPRRV